VWPTCLECQIQETDVGDYFMLGGTRAVQGSLPGSGGAGYLTVINRAGARGAGAPPPAGPRAGGPPPPPEPNGDRKLKDGDFEKLDDWNVVEVIAQGDRSTHIVNGRIVNLVSRIQQPDPQNAGQFVPLTRGRIAIEIEYAECWYRRIEIKPLS
jgi:3-keto-disaccharide hydrolase